MYCSLVSYEPIRVKTGAHDHTLNDSLKSYMELEKNNNCKLFVTNKGHSIPNLRKKNDYVSIVAINKIHKFIEKC